MSLNTAVICEEEAAKSQLVAQDTLKLREQENQDTLHGNNVNMFGVDFRAYYAKSRLAFAISVLIVLAALAYAISQGNTCIQSYKHLDVATSTEIVNGVPFPRVLLQLWNTSSETDTDLPLGLCKNDDELYYPFIISNRTYCLVNAAMSKIATSSNRYLYLSIYVDGDQNVSYSASDIHNNINVLAYSVPDAFRGTEIQVATRVLADSFSVERNWCPLFSNCEYIMSPLRHLRYLHVTST